MLDLAHIWETVIKTVTIPGAYMMGMRKKLAIVLAMTDDADDDVDNV